MAFNINPGKQQFSATAAQTVFTFNFAIFTGTDLKVYKTLAGAVANDITDLLIISTHYTVSINGTLGGIVTLLSGASLNDTITIVRSLPITRTTDYVTNGDLYADTLDLDQDNQTYLVLDQNVQLKRALVVPESLASVDLNIPAPIANSYLRWNATANAIENDTQLSSALNNIADISIVAADIASVVTTATNITNVNTVASSIANVNATGLNIANVNTVAADLLEPISEINTVAQSIGAVENVGAWISSGFPTVLNSVNMMIGTIATLRTTLYSGQSIVSVTGYYTAADNIGVREYYWDAVSVEADNGGTIIQVTGIVTGRWKMKYSGAVNVKWFGAVSDWNGTTGTDNSDFFNLAIQSSEDNGIVEFSGNYGVRKTILNNKTGVSIVGKNSLFDTIEAFDWISGSWVLDCVGDTLVETQSGFTHSNFTINGNNQLVGNMRVARPYDNASIINVKLLNTHANYNCLYLGGTYLSQTLYARNVFTMHYDAAPTVESVIMENLQESSFEVCKFWGAKYISGSPYAGVVKSLKILGCRSLQFDTLSIVASSGIAVSSVSRIVNSINFNNPLFEDTNGKISLIGSVSSYCYNVNILNPRHESPTSGNYIFGEYSSNCSLASPMTFSNVILETNSTQNSITTHEDASIVNSGTRNIILRYPNATFDTLKSNVSIEILQNTTPSLYLAVPTGGTTVNDTALYWSASQNVDNGLYIKKSGKIGYRQYESTGGQWTALYGENIPKIVATPFGVLAATDNNIPLGGATNRWSLLYATSIKTGAGTTTWTSGAGSPEGVLTAAIGSMYTRTDGGANTTLYIKESGAGNTGWVAK